MEINTLVRVAETESKNILSAMKEFTGTCFVQTAGAFSVLNLADLIVNVLCQKLWLICLAFLHHQFEKKKRSSEKLKEGQCGIEPLGNNTTYSSAADQVFARSWWLVLLRYVGVCVCVLNQL